MVVSAVSTAGRCGPANELSSGGSLHEQRSRRDVATQESVPLAGSTSDKTGTAPKSQLPFRDMVGQETAGGTLRDTPPADLLRLLRRRRKRRQFANVARIMLNDDGRFQIRCDLLEAIK